MGSSFLWSKWTGVHKLLHVLINLVLNLKTKTEKRIVAIIQHETLLSPSGI